jgi:peroxiredoxin
MKHIFTFFVVATVVFGSLSAQNVGEIAPDFSLKDLNDKDYKLSDNRGKVILVFLVGYNCTLYLASSPTVKSELTDVFSNNTNFQALVIDVWNGSKTSVQNFKHSTNINATYLQKGSAVASDWSSTKDRLIVIDADGKMVFKGSTAVKSDVNKAKSAVEDALNSVTTSVEIIDEKDGFSIM